MNLPALELTTRLRGYVRRRLADPSTVDDIVQEVLTRLWQHRDAVDDRSVTAWVFAVARAAIVDHFRARSRTPVLQSLGDEVAQADAEAPRELAGCMLRLLDTLPERDRELLRRVDLDGESQTELAAELKMSRSGLKSRVQRARARLRQALGDCCRFELDRTGLPVDEFQPRRTSAPEPARDEGCCR